MNVANIILTILNCTLNKSINPSIHIQLTANGKKDIILNSNLPNEIHKKANTINPHMKPI